MKVALITPTPLLNKFAVRSPYHLVLAHEYTTDEAYRQFYKERSEAGDYVMLDNGAYELGESIPTRELYHIASDLNPTAIFLPDARFHTKRTMQLVTEALQFLYGSPWQLIGVPQGDNLESILECYDWLQRQSGVDGFGLYEEIGLVAGLGNRANFLRHLEETDRVDRSKYYHLLGMEEDMSMIEKLASFDWVSGIDSAKPIVYGLHGIRLLPDGPEAEYPHRPKGYFEISETQFEDIIVGNIEQTLNWAKF